MRLRLLTWNLMHGRSVPGAGHDLLGAFTRTLAGWEWDVALLQEVPPWWAPLLATALGCEQRTVLTSRNAGLFLRRSVAVRWPDLIKSNGGGANVILLRADRVADERAVRLCRRPERRWAHGVRLAYGPWIVNLHATAHDPAAAARDAALAVRNVRAWAGELPLVVGGDFNLRVGQLGDLPGLRSVADSDVDHVLIDDHWTVVEPATVLERGALSDHLPLAVTVASEA